MSDKYICGACGAQLKGMNYRCECAGQTAVQANEWIERYERMKESFEGACVKLAKLEPKNATLKKALDDVIGVADTARNHIAQIRIASTVGDTAKVTQQIEKADALLFELQLKIENIQ